MAESAISVKPPKAVAGWFAAASDRQLGGATTIACVRPGAVLRGIATSDDFRLRLCENACSNEVDKKPTSQIALYAFFLTGAMVRRFLNFMLERVFTQPRLIVAACHGTTNDCFSVEQSLVVNLYCLVCFVSTCWPIKLGDV